MDKLSIGIVAYNEEKFLPNLLNDLQQQKYPHNLIEILLIDSMSTDKTRQLMEEFKSTNDDFYSIQVLNNPNKNQAAGWNVAVKNFTGEVLARIDAHTKLTPEYSLNTMKNINNGEYVVGGIRPCLIEEETPWANVLLQVENSLFGSSINSSRRSNEKKYVKTMFHAAYRREVFDRVGLFNEKLLRTEDNEMHYRIRKAGYKLLYDPSIISYQFSRNSLQKMIVQKFSNGYWIGKTIKICPECISLYHLVPLLFLISILITILLGLFNHSEFLIILWTTYSIFAFINTVVNCINNKFYAQSVLLPLLFLTLHLSYGIGTFFGLIKNN